MHGALIQGVSAVLAALIGGGFTVWVAREGKLDAVIGPAATATVTATVAMGPQPAPAQQGTSADGRPVTAASPVTGRRVYRSGHAKLTENTTVDLDTPPSRQLLSSGNGEDAQWGRLSDSMLFLSQKSRRLDGDPGPMDPSRCEPLDGYAFKSYSMKDDALQAGDGFCLLTTEGRFAMIHLTRVTQLDLEFDYVVATKDDDR